jgi:hypothetical protein
MRYQLIALLVGLIGTALLASPARGQGHGGRGFAPAARAGATISRGRVVGRHFVRMHHGRRAFAGSRFTPNYYPYYDSDHYPFYDSQDEVGEAPPPPFRPPAAVPASPANPPKPPESLLMELRGDHWVRLTSYGPMAIAGESGEPQSEAAQTKGLLLRFERRRPANFRPQCSCFATDIRKKWRNTRLSAPL